MRPQIMLMLRIATTCFVLLALTAVSFAEVPHLINVQGLLTDQTGDAVADGTHSVDFAIYENTSGGSAIWTETRDVTTGDGLFTILLGEVTPIPVSLFDTSDLWLGIAVAGEDEMIPRQRLATVPYVFQARTVADGSIQLADLGQNGAATDQILKWNGTAWTVADDEGGSGSSGGGWTDDGRYVRLTATSDSVGIGTNTPEAKLHVVGDGMVTGKTTFGSGHTNSGSHGAISGGTGSIVSADGAVVSGGDANTASGELSAIGGGQGNTASGMISTISGGFSNEVDGSFATVGGGSDNHAGGMWSTVGGGQQCFASGNWSVVAGGGGLTADSNAAWGESSVVSGGLANLANGHRSTISGGSENRVTGNDATISGGILNQASGQGSTIGGGEWNEVTAKYGTIGGGGPYDDPEYTRNRVTDDYGTVGGGTCNIAGDEAGSTEDAECATVGGGATNRAAAEYATVAGGYFNRVSGYCSTIGGGEANVIDSAQVAIGGGYGNRAGAHYVAIAGGSLNWGDGEAASIGGGRNNEATAPSATISGGRWNKVAAEYGTIGGGGYSTEADGNRVSDAYGTVGGGRRNQAGDGGSDDNSAYYATVGGGFANNAAGRYSTVPGGNNCTASGQFSFAAGKMAKAQHDGSFVWGDNTTSDIASTGDNQFIARASGGVWFWSNGAATTGVKLNPGAGDWSFASSRDLKTDFSEADVHAVLQKLAELPMETWRYKTEDPQIRHLGPISQDFRAAFGLGADDVSISTIDAIGVALAAIKALDQNQQELRERTEELDKLRRDMTVMQLQLQQLLEGR